MRGPRLRSEDMPAQLATLPVILRRRRHAAALIIAIAVLFVSVPAWFGLLSLPSLALMALVCGVCAIAALSTAPQILIVLIPALLPSPILAYVFAWEILLIGLALLIALHGWRTRAAWLFELSTLERFLILYTAWALVSWFWSPDLKTYLLGARRLLLGLATFWVALRLPRIASRAWFDEGLIAASVALAGAALARYLTSGFTDAQAMMRRSESTNLGWGTANFIATILLLLSPVLISIAMQERARGRLGAAFAAMLTAAMQMIIASRAAAVLYIGGTLFQVVRLRNRRELWLALGAIAALAGMLASPAGQALLFRFTSLRELGSMTIRIWYLREGWARMIEHLPFGMGLGQGYANADKLQGTDPHNFWLVVGGDLGIPGLILWATILVLLWRAISRFDTTPQWRDRGRAILIAMTLGHLHTLVEPTFQGTQYAFVFFWLLGGSIGYHAQEAAAAASCSR